MVAACTATMPGNKIMARQEYLYQGKTTAPAEQKAGKRASWTRQGWFRLLAIVMLAELFMPFLVWPLRLPRAVLGVTEVAVAVALLITFAYMMKVDKIPGVMLLVAGLTLIWGLVSAFEGQALSATAWGWWGLFKYPLLGVFAYLVQGWPADFARWFLKFCVGLLMFQILVQLLMLAAGFPVGDSLAGTFGLKGVMQFSMMTFFIVCLGLGHWLATHEWKTLILILVLGLTGSTLNGTKFYLIAVAVLAAAALVVHLVRGGQFRQLFLYVFLLGAAAAVFVPVYNSYLVESRGLRPLQEYLQPEVIESYLFTDGAGRDDSTYNIGRGLALTYAWQQIQRDTTTTLFGFGLGTRSQSALLGVRGNVLQEDLYGVGTTTLSTWIQEHGIVGMAVFLAVNLWIMGKLFRFARVTPDPYRATLAYGLILFTLFWPMWLWYHKAWTAGVMMVLYWVALGYTFRQVYALGRQQAAAVQKRAVDGPPARRAPGR
jgi:hypothetical protein